MREIVAVALPTTLTSSTVATANRVVFITADATLVVTSTYADAYTALIDIVVTGEIQPRRWHGSITRRWDGDIQPPVNEYDGNVDDRRWAALAGPRRWTGDL